MIASGDWPDVSEISNYTGGASQAYADEVILDLTSYLEEDMPSMWSYLEALDAVDKHSVQTEGMYLQIPKFNVNIYYDEGYFVREDWVEALGLSSEDLTDFDSFVGYLEAAYAAYGCEYTFFIDDDGASDSLQDVFGTALYQIQATTLNTYLSADGTTVLTALNSDGYRDYLEWFREMVTSGLINEDFYSASDYGAGERESLVGNSQIAAFTARADDVDTYYDYAADDSFALTAIGPFTDEDGSFDYANTSLPAEGGYCIYSDCEQVELALRFLDYFYTDDGILLCNYGIEDLSYEYDSDVSFTSVITNNENGWSSRVALTYYAPNVFGTVTDAFRYSSTYSDLVLETIDIFNNCTVTRDRLLDKIFSLSAEGTEATTSKITDICALADEAVLKFITGVTELNDETWEDFKQSLSDAGLDHVMEVYQEEYDNYLVEVAALQ